ncbi:uncharacterized protein DDB_G0283357-like isoform X2 [Culicoides brevitarsis]|uniref:uncharacterized protein DDB_G0283357-like isoform X2 n=1 Tax=Culicoides brevitarsis TaxID=469753 RepID=UPI00307BD6BB
MVNISLKLENTTCDISRKNILRSDSCDAIKNMGQQHGHLLHEVHQGMNDVTDALQQTKFKRYTKEYILSLRNAPKSKEKPACADDRPFWLNGKTVAPRQKKIDRAGRIGSGRLSGGSDKFNPPPAIQVQQYQDPPYHQNNNNYYREKTGREFCDNMNNNNNAKNDGEFKVSFFNPVNRDHRRLLREKSEENLPEWVNAGPKSRFDTIDLHGFYDDKGSRHESSSSTMSKSSENAAENKENRSGSSRGFSFDEFLGSQMNGGTEYGSQHGQASRFKRYFNSNNKNRDYHFANHPQNHQQAPPGFPPIQQNFNSRNFQPKFDSNNNEAASKLLELLHRQTAFDQFKQQSFNFGGKSNAMPSAAELESIWRHGNAERQRQFEHNKAMLAGKSIVDVIDVLTQSQLRANAMPFNGAQQNYQQQQSSMWNQFNGNNQHGSQFMKSNNQMNKFQMARVLERQMMVQGQNPMYGGLTPQDPEYWDKIRQQQQAFYQQYERNAATRQVKAKFPGQAASGGRRVKFDDKQKVENFFKSHQNMGDLPQIDHEKAIKVEEFERKIKQVAASCKQQELK